MTPSLRCEMMSRMLSVLSTIATRFEAERLAVKSSKVLLEAMLIECELVKCELKCELANQVPGA